MNSHLLLSGVFSLIFLTLRVVVVTPGWSVAIMIPLLDNYLGFRGKMPALMLALYLLDC